ncbi:MAG: site-2 protease family protein [Verrucomicrobiaceae bacterium]|nr:site-2 protease family protein [Verrucomicrobiaceae bacterium]
MRWSFHICTIAGTEVRIHATFLLLLAFVGWQALGQGAGVPGMLEAMALVCAMFSCVLLHEFGHVTAARRYGIRTPDITLLPIGGVARLERMPRHPIHELVVAICGPLVNVVIAIVIGTFVGWPKSFTPEVMLSDSLGFWQVLTNWNLLMVAFNLIPAFPMDGGRVLRALLAMIVSDYAKATRWAATIGQTIAVLVVMNMVLSSRFQPMLVLIAFFVFFAAGQEASVVEEEEAAGNMQVGDAMLTEFHTLPSNAVLREAVELLLAGTQHDFPVLDEDGTMMGVLTRRRLIPALADHGPGYPAQLIIEPCAESVEPRMSLVQAMAKLKASPCPAIPVIDPITEKMVGLLTAENVGEALLVRSALRQRMKAMSAS